MDLSGAWRAADDFLRRHLKTRAVREAERRRVERRRRSALRQGRNIVLAGGVSAAGGFAVAAALAPPVAAIAAGGAALLGIAGIRIWQSRARERFSSEELAALPAEAEEWLLDMRPFFPRGTEKALDTILVHLGDLPPFLAALHPNETLAWDTRRLLGEHLPTLVDSWCKLPSVTRERDGDARRRLGEGLETLAEELSRLTAELSRDERMRLETQSRFVESRYRDPRLGG
jgi:hypothetical protein